MGDEGEPCFLEWRGGRSEVCGVVFVLHKVEVTRGNGVDVVFQRHGGADLLAFDVDVVFVACCEVEVDDLEGHEVGGGWARFKKKGVDVACCVDAVDGAIEL